jgi:hypothetical protein
LLAGVTSKLALIVLASILPHHVHTACTGRASGSCLDRRRCLARRTGYPRYALLTFGANRTLRTGRPLISLCPLRPWGTLFAFRALRSRWTLLAFCSWLSLRTGSESDGPQEQNYRQRDAHCVPHLLKRTVSLQKDGVKCARYASVENCFNCCGIVILITGCSRAPMRIAGHI